MNTRIKLTEFFGWLRIPFTFGDACKHGSDEESREGGAAGRKSDDGSVRMTSYNGQVSAIQLFIVMAVISGVQLLSSNAYGRIDGSQTRVILVAYMIVGLVVMVGVYRKQQRFLFVASGTSREDERDNLTVAGILTFYVLGTLHDLVHITGSFSCQEAWHVCLNNYFFAKDMIHIAYHVVRIVYLACQTLFCVVFNHSYFLDRSLIRHGLMTLQAVNVGLWFYEVIQNLWSDVYGNTHPMQERANRFALECFPNVSNRSFDFASCLSNNNTAYYYLQAYGNPILRPFNIEYSLLVGKCIARWFITCRTVSKENKDELTAVQQRRPESLIGTEPQSDAHNTNAPRSYPSDTVERRRNRLAEQLTDTRLPQVQTSIAARLPTSRALSVVLLMISIIVNLLLANFIFLPRIPQALHVPSENFKSMRTIATYYSCFYYILMIASIALGFHISRQFRVLKNAPFSGLDYLLLFTSSGNLAFDLFRLIGVVGSNKKGVFTSDTVKAFYAGYVLLEVIETSFQVSFSLYARRLRIVNSGDRGLKPIFFRAIIVFLALCNLTTWIIQTFAVSIVSQPLVADYFGSNWWPYISNILSPLYLFFSFNSFLLFLRIYLRIRKRSP